MDFQQNNRTILLDKEVGETPLECLERFRASKITAGFTEFVGLPMTYAGRLDPLASGKLLILIGEECKKKDQYLGLDKEYVIEVLFGVKTDTGDMLGLIEVVNMVKPDFLGILLVNQFSGNFEQEYPAYSSKTVNGKQLHNLARAGELPDEMPIKQVEIYSIEKVSENKMNGEELAMKAIGVVSKVQGNFRQKEIIDGWKKFAEKYDQAHFPIIKLRVKCSSGTYMRSLAERMGEQAEVGAFALSICRTKIMKVEF